MAGQQPSRDDAFSVVFRLRAPNHVAAVSSDGTRITLRVTGPVQSTALTLGRGEARQLGLSLIEASQWTAEKEDS